MNISSKLPQHAMSLQDISVSSRPIRKFIGTFFADIFKTVNNHHFSFAWKNSVGCYF